MTTVVFTLLLSRKQSANEKTQNISRSTIPRLFRSALSSCFLTYTKHYFPLNNIIFSQELRSHLEKCLQDASFNIHGSFPRITPKRSLKTKKVVSPEEVNHYDILCNCRMPKMPLAIAKFGTDEIVRCAVADCAVKKFHKSCLDNFSSSAAVWTCDTCKSLQQ